MSRPPAKPPREVYYYRRGGIPTPASAWKSKERPDWVCEEGQSEWRPFESREERKIA